MQIRLDRRTQHEITAVFVRVTLEILHIARRILRQEVKSIRGLRSRAFSHHRSDPRILDPRPEEIAHKHREVDLVAPEFLFEYMRVQGRLEAVSVLRRVAEPPARELVRCAVYAVILAAGDRVISVDPFAFDLKHFTFFHYNTYLIFLFIWV